MLLPIKVLLQDYTLHCLKKKKKKTLTLSSNFSANPKTTKFKTPEKFTHINTVHCALFFILIIYLFIFTVKGSIQF